MPCQLLADKTLFRAHFQLSQWRALVRERKEKMSVVQKRLPVHTIGRRAFKLQQQITYIHRDQYQIISFHVVNSYKDPERFIFVCVLRRVDV